MPNDNSKLNIEVIDFALGKNTDQYLISEIQVKNKNDIFLENRLENPDKYIRVYLYKNFMSINDKNLMFTNFMPYRGCREEDVIKKICEIASKNKVLTKDIPFVPDDIGQKTELKINQRIFNIMKLIGINTNEISSIWKATYSPKDMFLHYKKQDNLIRIYYVEKGENIVILLIDFYHLFATNILKNYGEHSNNKYNIDITISKFMKKHGI